MRGDVVTCSWRNGSAGIWLQWALGSMVGCGLGCFVGTWLGSPVLAVLAIGPGAATLQAAILGRYIRSRALWWILIGALAWPVSIPAGYVGTAIWLAVFGQVLIRPLGPLPPFSLAPLVNHGVGLLQLVLLVAPGGGAAGIVYGALQWLVISQPGFTERGWLAAHAASGLVLVAAFFSLLLALVEDNTFGGVAIAALGGAIYGAITGLPLSRMLASKRAVTAG